MSVLEDVCFKKKEITENNVLQRYQKKKKNQKILKTGDWCIKTTKKFRRGRKMLIGKEEQRRNLEKTIEKKNEKFHKEKMILEDLHKCSTRSWIMNSRKRRTLVGKEEQRQNLKKHDRKKI